MQTNQAGKVGPSVGSEGGEAHEYVEHPNTPPIGNQV